MADVGLTEDRAQQLRGPHANNIRAVLNRPAHLTQVTTQDLYDTTKSSVQDTIGATITTNTILGAPYHNSSIAGPKTLF